ncbi:hypothetical protein AAIB41_16400 [Brucella sp. BE17]|uniref:hypothetical protein n=1 Tax=Brucella sp. BE17 TaxID=3142977 RepID=UPI0031B9DDF2
MTISAPTEKIILMSDDPIVPPQPHPKRALVRGIAEGAVEIIPGASLLTNIYAVTHPPIEELERQRWEWDITQRSNEQADTLKRVVSAFLRIKANSEQAGAAQKLSFVRGGMITTLEAIGREGLSAQLAAELRSKLDQTAADVDDLLQGLDAAILAMRYDERNREFIDIMHEAVFGSFGKSTIRKEIQHLLESGQAPIDQQKELAQRLGDSIDHFNANLARLSTYATAVNL